MALLREQAEGLATFSVGYDEHTQFDERGGTPGSPALSDRPSRGGGHRTDAVAGLPAMSTIKTSRWPSVALPQHFVCGLAREQGIKVVLCGEGADELFWGYTRYRKLMAQWTRLRLILAMPTRARRLLPLAVPAQRHPHMHELLEGLAAGRPMPAHLPLGLSKYHRRQMLGDDDGGLAPGWAPSGNGRARGADLLRQFVFDTQEYEFGLRLPELLLMRIDRFSMANSVEARVPFLDPELVQFVYRLPLEHKLQDNVTKVVLRKAVEDAVPEWVLQRPKQGFGAPVVDWFGSSLGLVFRPLMREEAIAGYFDVPAIEAALNHRRRGVTFSLWAIMNFALWHVHWIEGRDLRPLLTPTATVTTTAAATP